VEVVVSAAITGLVILGVANLWGQSSQMFQQLRQRNSQEALIEEDIAAMEDLGFYLALGGAALAGTLDFHHHANINECEDAGRPDVAHVLV
jgi:hypothetical protein